MKYQIRQRVFSLGDSYNIKDELDNERFRVRSELFTLGHKTRIEDMEGNELVYIKQELFHLLPVYNIYEDENFTAAVKKQFSFFKPSFDIESSRGNYTIEGDYFSHEFNVLKDGEQVACVSKAWFSFSDAYGVDINDSEDQPFILALVIVIDEVLYDNHDK